MTTIEGDRLKNALTQDPFKKRRSKMKNSDVKGRRKICTNRAS
jgi:hypothetical protein